jgi:hypothetical protein
MTQQLDQSLRILPSSFLCCLLFLRNISIKDREHQLLWRNNKSTIEKFEGRSSSWFFFLSTCFSILESLCFVWTVGYGNVIQSSGHGRLTTSRTFTINQAALLPGVRSTKIVVWRREFILVAIETLSAILLNNDTRNSGRCDGEWGSNTISGRSSSWHLRMRLLEYETHLANDYYRTRYSSYCLPPTVYTFDGVCNVLPRTALHH